MEEYVIEQEIRQQPEVIQRLLDLESSKIAEITNTLRGKFDYIMIAARGTSDNAARYAQYLFGIHNRIPVALATPSIFTIYNQPLQLKRVLVIGISQSGQSPDIVQVIKEANIQNCRTIALTNVPDSPLGHEANFVIALRAETEKAVAATKTYTSSLACMALFSSFLSGNKEHLDDLSRLPHLMAEVLRVSGDYFNIIQRYRYMNHCAVIGRGLNYSTAFEIALKIKELTGIIAEPYSSADFRHGPIAMVREGFPTILIAPTSAVSDDLHTLIKDLSSLKGEIIVISDNSALLENANLPLPIPSDIPEWLTPMIAVIPGQMFAYLLTIVKGLNPDHPEGIQKITETY
jgi:glutamine---fructose-6-phosphate transaminase (isomerizing)